MQTGSPGVVWSLRRSTAMHLIPHSPNVNWVTYTMTSTPGFSSNWTRFWLRALKRISTTWWNNKRYGSHNKEDSKLWRTFRNACGQWMVANISYWLQEEKGSERLKKWRDTCSCGLDRTECYCMQVSLQDFWDSQSMLLYLSWEANQESFGFLAFWGFFWKHRWGGKQWRIFSPFTMSCQFDLMHLEITGVLPFHWRMMELSEVVQPSNTYLHWLG